MYKTHRKPLFFSNCLDISNQLNKVRQGNGLTP